MNRHPILIVDDNLDSLMLSQMVLEDQGFEVRLAEDAPQALERLRSYRPKLILMDIELPGMNGLELTRKLRQDKVFGDVKIVALTANATRADEAAAHGAGCDGYLTKPIDTRTFSESVRSYL